MFSTARQEGDPARTEWIYPGAFLNEKFLEVEDEAECLPREPMREALRQSKGATLTLYQALDILNSEVEEGHEGATSNWNETPTLGVVNAPAGEGPPPEDPRKRVRDIVAEMWGELPGYFERWVRGQEGEDLAVVVVQRVLEREERLFTRSNQLIAAFVWFVARKIRFEAWKRARTVGMWARESPPEVPDNRFDLDEWLSGEYAHRDGESSRDSEALVADAEEDSEKRHRCETLRAHLSDTEQELLAWHDEHWRAVARGEKRDSLTPKDRMRIFKIHAKMRELNRTLYPDHTLCSIRITGPCSREDRPKHEPGHNRSRKKRK